MKNYYILKYYVENSELMGYCEVGIIETVKAGELIKG